MSTVIQLPRTYNQNHLLDLELSVGDKPECRGNGQSFLDHDRGPQSSVAGV